MFTSLQSIILTLALPLYLLALAGMFLRWSRTRDGLCGSCAHPIAEGQSDHCVECGASLATLRSRRFEPRWIRRSQLVVGFLALAGIGWTTFMVVAPARAALSHEWLVGVAWADGTETVFTATRRQMVDRDVPTPKSFEGVLCFVVDSGEPLTQFRVKEADSGFVVQFMNANESPISDWTAIPDERAFADLLLARGDLKDAPLVALFADMTFKRARLLSFEYPLTASMDFRLPDQLDDKRQLNGYRMSSNAVPFTYRASAMALAVTSAVMVALVLLLLRAAYWRSDRVKGKSPANPTSDGHAALA